MNCFGLHVFEITFIFSIWLITNNALKNLEPFNEACLPSENWG